MKHTSQVISSIILPAPHHPGSSLRAPHISHCLRYPSNLRYSRVNWFNTIIRYSSSSSASLQDALFNSHPSLQRRICYSPELRRYSSVRRMSIHVEHSSYLRLTLSSSSLLFPCIAHTISRPPASVRQFRPQAALLKTKHANVPRPEKQLSKAQELTVSLLHAPMLVILQLLRRYVYIYFKSTHTCLSCLAPYHVMSHSNTEKQSGRKRPLRSLLLNSIPLLILDRARIFFYH